MAQLKPNGNGLYDMHGNVWEWTEDAYSSSPPSGTDPVGTGAAGSNRVLRGGSWADGAGYLRSAYRSYGSPAARNQFIGFRLVEDSP